MGFIVGLVVALIAIGLIIASFQFLLKIAKYIAAAAVFLYLAPGGLLGYASYHLSHFIRAPWLAQPTAILVSGALVIICLGLRESLWAGAFALSLLLSIGGTINRARASRSARAIAWSAAARIVLRRLDLPSHLTLWLLVTAFVAQVVAAQPNPLFHAWVSWGYWIVAVLAQGFASLQLIDFTRVIRTLERQVPDHKGTSSSRLVSKCKESATLLDAEIDELFSMHVASHVLGGRLVEVEVGSRTLVYASSWYTTQLDLLQRVLVERSRISDEELERLTRQFLGLDLREGIEHLSLQVQIGRRYQMDDGYFFVPYAADYHVESCASCGMGRHVLTQNAVSGEWFCSDTCKVTEHACVEIHRQTPESFIADTVGLGMALVSSSDSWVRNHKVFAKGAQGHGPGAEHANSYLDRLIGRFAKSVGADNAKNGADRIVDGAKVQTKYCKTAGKSVGQAFDENKRYRYWDGEKPMQLEVPRDQYEKALADMRRRIKQGHMQPVTDPDEAVNIIRKGHLTYEHARNLTKFGTWESLTYDAAEGMVAGAGSATIGFSITAGLVYIRTGDAKVALQAAVIQAGKSGLVAAVSHVGAQQLHRIELVQSALQHVELSCLSPSVQKALMAGYGVTSVNHLNYALRGNIVSAVVSVALTSVPDVYRLIRREVTLAKLKRTVVTGTGAAVGGAAGMVAGGAVGSAVAGPFGTWAGKIIGGSLGAMAVGALIDAFFAEQKDREREAANAHFRAHLEHLALGFSLSEEELRCVIRNFLRLSNDEMHQKILAGKNNGRQYLNSVLKPIVVGVVKQRDYIRLAKHEPPSLLDAA
jgi:hypothetical protein